MKRHQRDADQPPGIGVERPHRWRRQSAASARHSGQLRWRASTAGPEGSLPRNVRKVRTSGRLANDALQSRRVQLPASATGWAMQTRLMELFGARTQ